MDDLALVLIALLAGIAVGYLIAYLYVRKELRRIIKDCERNAEEYMSLLWEVHKLRMQIKNEDNE